MSATLTWHNSGLGEKTGTTIGNLIDDLAALINSKAADPNFSWQVASSNSAATPFYLVLKRKNGSAGRVLIVSWSSLPAGNNPALLTAAPNTQTVYVSYFPNGNVDSPSNLTAASGTILGDDTGCNRVYSQYSINTIYTTGVQPFYFDSAEAIFIGLQDPAAANIHGFGAGYLFVDDADNVYPGVIRPTTNASLQSFSGSLVSCFPWTDTALTPSSTAPYMAVNYVDDDSTFFGAYAPAGAWAAHAIDSTDILTDTANSKAWFVPYPILGRRKGEGTKLKLRQIGHGPGSTGPFAQYSINGPSVAAMQFCARTTGSNGAPWFTNFKM